MFRPEYDPDVFYHWHEIEVRYRDLDTLNHVNNAVYNSYFEEARINFVYHIPEFAEGLEKGKSFVLVKSTIEYLKPVTYPNSLLVGSSGLELGNTSIEVIQALYSKQTKQLHAIAKVKGVWFDVAAQRPSRLPDFSASGEMMIKADLDG